MKAYIESIGIISRCAQSIDEVSDLLRGSEYVPSACPIDFPSRIPPAKMRRSSRYNKLACTAADNAVSTAGIPDELDRHRIGTILSTGYGSSVSNTQFAYTVTKQVPGLCSPAIYAGTVPNACVGQICILHGFKGVSTMLTGGDPLEYSAVLLETDKADRILCGSIEEYNEELYSELENIDALKGAELSEGVAMTMLSGERTDRTICEVSGFSSASLGKSPLLHRTDMSAADVVSDVLKRYDDVPDAVFNSANGTFFDEIENDGIHKTFCDAELFSTKKYAGETLGCGYMMNVTFATAAIRTGQYRSVLVTGVDMVGNYCTAMLESVL